GPAAGGVVAGRPADLMEQPEGRDARGEGRQEGSRSALRARAARSEPRPPCGRCPGAPRPGRGSRPRGSRPVPPAAAAPAPDTGAGTLKAGPRPRTGASIRNALPPAEDRRSQRVGHTPAPGPDPRPAPAPEPTAARRPGI